MLKNQRLHNVLRPRYIKTASTIPVYSQSGQFKENIEVFRVEWTVVGQAIDMADAKAKFGGAPVLEASLT